MPDNSTATAIAIDSIILPPPIHMHEYIHPMVKVGVQDYSTCIETFEIIQV